MSCAKCRQCAGHGNDSWCLGCTAAQAINTELSAKWPNPALREVANDLVVSAVRGITALRNIACGLKSAEISRAAQSSQLGAGGSHPAAPARVDRRALPVPPPPPVKEQEESSEEESEEEVDEEDTTVEPPGAAPTSDPSRRPAEPNHPPPHLERAPLERRPPPQKRHRSRDRRESDHHHRERKSKRRGNRGGGKHPRLYRTLSQPDLRVHRRLPRSYWEAERPLAGPWAERR